MRGTILDQHLLERNQRASRIFSSLIDIFHQLFLCCNNFISSSALFIFEPAAK
jgi:hypothetical protein